MAMSRILFLFSMILLFSQTPMYPQAPQSMNWQGVALQDGNPLTAPVQLSFEIRRDNANGPIVFSEQQTVTPGPQGVLNVLMGQNSTQFQQIAWGAHTHFLHVRLNGTDLGTTQILSVPYALFSLQSATALDDQDKDPSNEIQHLAFDQNSNTLSLTGSPQTVNLSGLGGGGNDVWENINDTAYYMGKSAIVSDPVSLAGIGISPDKLFFIPASEDSASMNYSWNGINYYDSKGLFQKDLTLNGDGVHLNSAFSINNFSSARLNVSGLHLAGGSLPGENFTEYTMNGIESSNSYLDIQTGLLIRDDVTINGITAGRGPGNNSTNTVFGNGALISNQSSTYSTAIGSSSAFSMTNGIDNTAIGADALNTIVANSNYNTAVGSRAGSMNSIGTSISNGTFIGFQASPNSSPSFNASAIGYDARTTGNNQVRIGNSSVTSIGGFVNFTNISDGRYKTNVREDVPGLEFLLKLRPVSYRLDVNGLAGFLGEDRVAERTGRAKTSEQSELDIQAREAATAQVRTGFIAQEVEAAAREIGYPFSGVDAPANEESLYGLRYAEFVVPLVKAIQEQQEQIKTQQELIIRLEERIKALEAK